MTETDLATHVAVRDGPEAGICLLQIRDAFVNYAVSDDLKAALKELCKSKIEAGTRSFVVDLAPVTVMDSCGLSVLISAKKTVECEGGRLHLSSLSPMLQRLFQITKLDRVFEIHADERAALEALRAAA